MSISPEKSTPCLIITSVWAVLALQNINVRRLGDMLRSRSQWAQADAAGCLGWLIGHIQGTALHELLPLVTQLMVRHTTTDDEVFLREEREREDRKSWGRNRGGKATGGGGGGGGRRGGGYSSTSGDGGENGKDLNQDDQARERMDNIRVYTLIFLLKVMLWAIWLEFNPSSRYHVPDHDDRSPLRSGGCSVYCRDRVSWGGSARDASIEVLQRRICERIQHAARCPFSRAEFAQNATVAYICRRIVTRSLVTKTNLLVGLSCGPFSDACHGGGWSDLGSAETPRELHGRTDILPAGRD